MGTDFGHVFIGRGDILDLACDAIVVPTDAWLTLEGPWRHHVDGLRHASGPVTLAPSGQVEGLSSVVDAEGVYGPLFEEAHPTRETWLVATGVAAPAADLSDRDRLDAAVDALRDVLLRFADAFRDGSQASSTRGCPLVAVPLIGHGQGGFAANFRRYADRLIRVLEDVAAHAEIDIALVIWGQTPNAEALEALCRLARGGVEATSLAGSWRLGDTARPPATTADVSSKLERLLDKARTGELVPFFGAGVSLAGGAPSWARLVAQLDRDGRLEQAGAQDLDLLAQAQIVANSYESSEAFARAIGERLHATPISLQHLLLAALDARDAVTTNFDDAYERAVESSGRGSVAVVPQQATRRRLLKLHGSLDRTTGTLTSDGRTDGGSPGLPPVLTRDQFLEHEHQSGPLRGALQMMLLTGHVVFIGYSLRDPGLHAAIHEVRRIRKQAGIAEGDAPLATALQIEPSPQLSFLWSPTIDVLWPWASEDVGEGEGAGLRPRELEILLDALGDAASLHELPVLAFPPGQLEDDELALRHLLERLKEHFAGELPHHVRVLLAAYGDREVR